MRKMKTFSAKNNIIADKKREKTASEVFSRISCVMIAQRRNG